MDPLQVSAYSSITTARRVLAQQPDLMDTFRDILIVREEARWNRTTLPDIGPVAQFLPACSTASLSISSENCSVLFHLQEENATQVEEIEFITCDEGRLKHTLRQSMRMELWDDLRRRRPNFEGAGNGFNRDISSHLFRSNKLSGLSKYNLRVIMAGAVPTMSRVARENKEVSDVCPCCGQEPETTEHLFLRCNAHEVWRNSLLLPDFFQSLPNCCKLHGLVPVDMALPMDFDQNREGLIDFAYCLQHTLLGIYENRQRLVGTQLAPRW